MAIAPIYRIPNNGLYIEVCHPLAWIDAELYAHMCPSSLSATREYPFFPLVPIAHALIGHLQEVLDGRIQRYLPRSESSTAVPSSSIRTNLIRHQQQHLSSVSYPAKHTYSISIIFGSRPNDLSPCIRSVHALTRSYRTPLTYMLYHSSATTDEWGYARPRTL